MRVLAVSDTHDNILAVKAILDIIRSERPEVILHCGDYISPFTIRMLCGHNTTILGVWGNNDGDKQTILDIIMGEGFTIDSQPREIMLDGTRVLLIHGWKNPEKTKKIVHAIARGGKYDIVLYGHTHQVDVSIVKDGNVEVLGIKNEYVLSRDDFDVLILNPGEACGWLTGRGTVMLLDISERIAIRILDVFSM